MDSDKIKYEDLISPDDSVKNLIEQLETLNKSYGEMITAVRSGAKAIIEQMKSMSTATSEGRAQIDEATAAANRLERAQKELKFALSDTGKEVAWLKSQTASQNKMSIEQQKRAQALAGSYDLIKIQVKDLTRRYRELSAADRAGDKGDRLLGQLLGKKQQLADLDQQMKLHIQTLSAVEKAEQKLAYLRSDEGKRLLQLKQAIAEEIAANKTKKASIDEVAQAQARLKAAQDVSRAAIYEYNAMTREANRIAKLQVQFNMSAEGSYNELAAKYELNKIKLNAMSKAEREAVDIGKKLEAETLAIYQRMIELQEATGNHKLSIGNYAKSWDGLGVAVSQVVRELPAVAVSLNTFFLGISNNIPILVDEINKLREANKRAIAEGKPAKSVIGSIMKSLLGWNTLLVIGLTVLSSHGKQIIDWIGKLFKARKAVLSNVEANKMISEELKNTNASYGKNIATLKRLANEWKNLKKEDQLKWIRNNKTAFDQLDVSIKNVNDATALFVEHTDAFVDALKLRAKATAAAAIAEKKYEEAFAKREEAETYLQKYEDEGPSFFQRLYAHFFGRTGTNGPNTGYYTDVEGTVRDLYNDMVKEADDLESIADKFIKKSEDFDDEYNELLKKLGLTRKSKKDPRTPRGRQPRDLTDLLYRKGLKTEKDYESSISDLQQDDFRKRRSELFDQISVSIREYENELRKYEDYLTNPNGKYKPLTSEQKQQIAKQIDEITATIQNKYKQFTIDLQKLEDERQLHSMQTLRQAEDFRLDTIEDSIEKEKQLRLKQLDDEIAMRSTVTASNSDGGVTVTGTRTPEQIAADMRKRQQIIAEYDQIIYKMRQKDIEAQIELVKKGTEEELKLLLQQNEIARQLALAENRAKPIEQRQSESQINAQFDKRGANIKGSNVMTNFDEAQAQAEAEFNIVKRNETQITIFKLKAEQDRWRKQVQLAKEGALDWSDAQIAEAEAMIKKLDREIDEASSFTKLVGTKGIGGALLTKLGLDDDQIAALSEAVNIVLENIKAIADAEVEAAEAAVAAAQKRVDAAQEAYDAEIEGRNNGYANSVATAKKELQQEKRNQAQKQKLLEEAQRRQEAINTLIQTSSLITASANLWSSFSSIPIAGPALALAAIAAMWTSFAVAKVKAAQVTKQASQEYGEGGLEFLEGGSHASGNDIDLQTKNSRGKNMRAEGGEAMAIINRRNTRRYRKLLPQLVNSLNNGTFEDKFIGAFRTGDKLAQQINYQTREIDLSRLEEDVRALKRNTEKRYYTAADGATVEIKRNVTRYIR